MKPEYYMRRSIELSRHKMSEGERPFGAVVVRGAEIVGEGSAQQQSTHDPTAHAEIVAIRAAAKALRSNDLSDCEIYASCAPCPMCTAAIWITGIRKVYYANVHSDMASPGAERKGSAAEQIALPLERRTKPHVRLLADEAKCVVEEWKALQDPSRSITKTP